MSADDSTLSDESIEDIYSYLYIKTTKESDRTRRYILRIINKTKTMSGTGTSTGNSKNAQTKREEFILDPFSANINPGTGSGRKLFLKQQKNAVNRQRWI